MHIYELIAPCHFGLESEVKREIYDLGYEITQVEDGRVTFEGDAEAIVRANLQLRIVERVLLKVGSFEARSFEELFQGTKALPWEEFLPADAKFWVTKAASVKSQLFSPSDIQSIMKKAMVERMAQHYDPARSAGGQRSKAESGRRTGSAGAGRTRPGGTIIFPETGAAYPIRVFIKKDLVTAAIDTTGESLHKRGYRKYKVAAPIAENLAAGLLSLTPWKPGRILVDPFCGSGTFLIEAAMISANIAPGLAREFTAQSWTNLIPETLWEEVRQELREEIDLTVPCDLQGYDIDRDAIYAARENAKLAGVERMIHFQVRPVNELSHAKPNGFLITNPPYGERLMPAGRTENRKKEDRMQFPPGRPQAASDRTHPGKGTVAGEAAGRLTPDEAQELQALYRTLGERYRALDAWSMYVITSYEDAEKALGITAAKKRKIYNGMIRTNYYSFPGPKPVR